MLTADTIKHPIGYYQASTRILSSIQSDTIKHPIVYYQASNWILSSIQSYVKKNQRILYFYKINYSLLKEHRINENVRKLKQKQYLQDIKVKEFHVFFQGFNYIKSELLFLSHNCNCTFISSLEVTEDHSY